MFDPSCLPPHQADAYQSFWQAQSLFNGEAAEAFPDDGRPCNPDCVRKLASRTAEVIESVESLHRAFGLGGIGWRVYADQLRRHQ